MTRLIPLVSVEEATTPGHPWYELPVPWSNGASIETWTYRGCQVPDSAVVEAQHACAEAGRRLAAHEVVRELVENDGVIPLNTSLL